MKNRKGGLDEIFDRLTILANHHFELVLTISPWFPWLRSHPASPAHALNVPEMEEGTALAAQWHATAGTCLPRHAITPLLL